ncbi:hypothetical protein TNCV_4437181 [Trichonephila clavipes]|nr:hypothetical protein TNCV_4437181 [Trichonephila clavipes]
MVAPPPQFWHDLEGREIFSSTLHLWLLLTSGPTDLLSTNSVCIGRLFVEIGDIELRLSDLEYDAITTRIPTDLLVEINITYDDFAYHNDSQTVRDVPPKGSW